MNAPDFESRWLITGTLTTETELHIGDGFSGELLDRSRRADKSEGEHDAQTVCVDHAGHAFIPSSSLKGSLRSRLKESGDWNPSWEALLGSDTPDSASSVGGKLSFFDAFLTDPLNTTRPFAGQEDYTHPYWDQTRRTCVSASVCIDRRTRTAADKQLYHNEYVPPGQSFTVRIGGENLSEEEVGLLLGLLGRLNGEDRVTLGAQASNSWGAVTWKQTSVTKFTKEDMKKWVTNTAGEAAGFELKGTPQEVKVIKPPRSLGCPALTFDLTLSFPGPLLIRDSRQAKRVEKHKKGKTKEEAQKNKPPDSIPLRDEAGRHCIPAKAIRGVFRARAEMIRRTLGKSVPQPRDLPVVNGLAPVGGYLREVRALDLVVQLFGASGWLAPWQNTRFTITKSCPAYEQRQEFVAIDRFTGSAAGQKKFDALAVVGAQMQGCISVDLRRIAEADRPEVIRLLKLLMQDVLEGDLCFGSGAAKGYGHCTLAEGTVKDADATIALNEWIYPVETAVIS